MRIEAVRLHNFGVYLGFNELRLSVDAERPVTLVLGRNGRGKTTLLDGVKLALYGSRARVSGRHNSSYQDYLKGCIHSAADPSQGGHVGLTFRALYEGRSCRFDLDRYWRVGRTGRVSEVLDVHVDGAQVPALERSWDAFIEDMLPVAVSEVVFFDGERLEDLIGEDQSSEVVGAAVRALFGAGLVRSLRDDLSFLLAKRYANGDAGAALQAVEQKLRDLSERRESLLERTRETIDRKEGILQRLRVVQERLLVTTGEANLDEATLRAERTQLALGLNQLKARRLELVAGELPLLLLGDRLLGAIERVRCDHESALDSVRAKTITELRALVHAALETNANEQALDEIEQVFEAELARYRPRCSQQDTTFEHLRGLLPPGPDRLDAMRREALEVQQAIEEAQQELDAIDGILHGLDSEEAQANRLEQSRLEEALEDADTELRQIGSEIEAVEIRLETVKNKEHIAAVEAVARHDRLADRIGTEQRLLEVLERRMVNDVLARLERSVQDRFAYLIGKSGLLTSISIDPERFGLTLYASDAQRFPITRLSAGERQLLAVSVIWAIKELCGASITAIIDTPLGRLDLAHRSHILERYVPQAGANVVVLATDAEVGADDWSKIERSVHELVELNYKDDRRATELVSLGKQWGRAA